MSTSYQPTLNDRAADRLHQALIDSGYVNQRGNLIGDPGHMVAALRYGLHYTDSTAPWETPFALFIREEWLNLDNDDVGDVQMRIIDGTTMQVRVKQPCKQATTIKDHSIGSCANCWTMREIAPSQYWITITSWIQIRSGTPSGDAPSHRIEIRRRLNESAPQPRTDWTKEWAVPKYHQVPGYDYNKPETSWVSVTADIQISDGHTFPRGILVRRATGGEETPWTTPRFLPETHWRWMDLVEDGSVQYRCWQPSEETKGWRIEARQRVGRVPVFSVEPIWGKTIDSYRNVIDGYVIELLREDPNYYSNFRSVLGVTVTDPKGKTRKIFATNRYILIAPNLCVYPYNQGSFWCKQGTFEPQAPTITWSMPMERELRAHEWTYLGGQARARISGRHNSVEVEILQNNRWTRDGDKPLNTDIAHEFVNGIRVIFRPDWVAEVQIATPVNAD